MLIILGLGGLWLGFSGSLMMMMVVMSLMGGLSLSVLMNGELSYVSSFMELDKLGLLLIVLCLWMTVIMVLVSSDVKLADKNYNLYYKLMVVLNLILLLTFSTNDYIWFFIFFEVTMIPTLGLIVGWGYQPERMKAMFYMLIYTMISSLPLLLILLKGKQNLFSSYFFLGDYNLGSGGALVFVFLVLSMLVKLPVYNLHLWLPKAHVEAPLAGSIVLAAILLKLGGYGLFRLMNVFTEVFVLNSDSLMILGILGAVFSSAICMRQVDTKSLIAYSSVAHMGVMLGSMSNMSVLGMQGGLLMLIAHGFSSSFLFFLAFMNYNIFGSRSSMLSSGLLKVFPLVSLMWFMGSLMGLGVPPSLSFVAEVNINCSVVLSGVLCGLVLSGVLFMGAVYSLYLYTSSSHGLVKGYSKSISGVPIINLVVGLMHMFPGFMLVLSLGVFLL